MLPGKVTENDESERDAKGGKRIASVGATAPPKSSRELVVSPCPLLQFILSSLVILAFKIQVVPKVRVWVFCAVMASLLPIRELLSEGELLYLPNKVKLREI